MNEEIYESEPPRPGDKPLLEAFHQEIVKQNDRLDALAKEMIKLELGIPGVFAVALTLLAGKDAFISAAWLLPVFIFWMLAAGLTFLSLFPRRYKVLEDTPRREEVRKVTNDALTIQEYFQKSTKYKYSLLCGAAVFFFLGTILAVVSIFSGS